MKLKKLNINHRVIIKSALTAFFASVVFANSLFAFDDTALRWLQINPTSSALQPGQFYHGICNVSSGQMVIALKGGHEHGAHAILLHEHFPNVARKSTFESGAIRSTHHVGFGFKVSQDGKSILFPAEQSWRSVSVNQYSIYGNNAMHPDDFAKRNHN